MHAANPDPFFAPTIDSDVVRTGAATRTLAKPGRLLSIDVLRGLTLAFMILVNAQLGTGFRELLHAPWNGFTATDEVYPTFQLLVGMSIVLSTQSRLARGAKKMSLFWHTLWRATVLFLFSLTVNNFPYFHMGTFRVYGVLERIAICYLIVSTLYLVRTTWKDKAVLAVLCVAGYWALMRFVPVPGYGVPVRDVPINDVYGNLSGYVDRLLFKPAQMYAPFGDPEGVLTTIPALATMLIGLLAGVWVRTNRTVFEKSRGLAIAGVSFLVLGGLWNFEWPINKKLWTGSFVLWAGGWSLLLLALAMYLVDGLRLGRRGVDHAEAPEHPTAWKPLLVFGTNSILAYMVSELGDSILSAIHVGHRSLKGVLIHGVQSCIANAAWASLAWGLLYVAACWLVVYAFYRKRIFLKI